MQRTATTLAAILIGCALVSAGEDPPAKTDDEKPKEEGSSLARLRVKFADGTEVEVDGALLLAHPNLMDDLLDRAALTSDGLAAFRLNGKSPRVSLKKLARMLRRVAPTAEAEHFSSVHLLVLTAEEPKDLRVAATLCRKLGYAPARPRRAADSEETVQTAAPAPTEPQPVEGQVQAIQTDDARKQKFVMLSIGRDDGLTEGALVEVHREDKLVGHGVVVRLWDDQCKILPLNPYGEDDIRQGDRAVFRPVPPAPPPAPEKPPEENAAGEVAPTPKTEPVPTASKDE